MCARRHPQPARMRTPPRQARGQATRAGNAGGHTAVAAAQLDLYWARLVRACHQGKAALSAGGGQVATSVVAPPARGRERAVPQTLARGWCKALPRAKGRQARPQDIIMSTYGCRVATAASGFRLRQQRLLWYAMQQVWCGRCARKCGERVTAAAQCAESSAEGCQCMMPGAQCGDGRAAESFACAAAGENGWRGADRAPKTYIDLLVPLVC